MRAHNRRVKVHLALRNVAGGAEIVIVLDAARVICAGGEVDIVVARAARGARRIDKKCGRLRGARGLRVTSFATPRIARIRRKRYR